MKISSKDGDCKIKVKTYVIQGACTLMISIYGDHSNMNSYLQFYFHPIFSFYFTSHNPVDIYNFQHFK